MSKLDTKVMFDVMRISPGPALLSMMMDPANNLPSGISLSKEDRERGLHDYSLFPFYNTD
ncbi:hypothetical protein FRC18_005953 [Serendipita sp. 400]|nr:hypothetical protein FRC18_005953 [Serendipita sp. 400]